MIPGVPVFAEPVLGDQAPPGRPSNYAAFLGRSQIAGMYLADITYRRRDDAKLLDAPTRVLAEPVFTDPPQGGFTLGRKRRLFMGSHTWIGRGDDTRRRQAVARPRLRAAVNATRTFPFLPDQARATQTTSGYIEIANDDAAFDWLPAAGTVAGLEQEVWHGPRRGYFSDFQTRLFALGKSTEGKNKRIRIELENDNSPLLTPVAGRYYTGQGGLDGDPELASQPVPNAVGNCWNISLTRISRQFEVWQAALGPIQQFVEVSEAGLPMTPTQDYPTWNALIQADIPPFRYATCLALGLVRFGTPPVGVVTAHVLGIVADGGYIGTLDRAAEWLLRRRAFLSPTQYDRASFLAAGAQEIGWFTGSADLQVADFFEEAARSIVGFHGRGLDGRYRLKGVVAPERLAAPAAIPVPGVKLVKEHAGTFVRLRQTSWYRRNYTIMSDSDISEAVGDARRNELKSRGLSVTLENGSAQNVGGSKPGEDIDTIFVQRNAANAANRTVIELLGIERDIYSAPVGRRGFLLDGGDPVTFTTDRYGADGQVFVVQELVENSNGEQLTARVIGAARRLEGG